MMENVKFMMFCTKRKDLRTRINDFRFKIIVFVKKTSAIRVRLFVSLVKLIASRVSGLVVLCVRDGSKLPCSANSPTAVTRRHAQVKC